MSGIKIYNTGFNHVKISKGRPQFDSWIFDTGHDDTSSPIQNTALGTDSGYLVGGIDSGIRKYDKDMYLTDYKKSNHSIFDINSIIPAHDGGYIIAGGTHHTKSYIAKVDDNLVFSNASEFYYTDTGKGAYRKLFQLSGGGYLALGETFMNYNSYYRNYTTAISMVSYSINLDVVEKKYIYMDNIKDGVVTDAIETSDGGYVVTGYGGYNQVSDPRSFVCKLDSNLDLVAYRVISGTYTVITLNGVCETSDGNYFVVGYGRDDTSVETNSRPTIFKYDSNLSLLDSKTVRTGTFAYAVTRTKSNEYVLAGRTGGDMLFVKFDNMLSNFEARQIAYPGTEIVNDLITSDDGGLVAVGRGSTSMNYSKSIVSKIPTDLSLISGTVSNHPDVSGVDISIGEITTPTFPHSSLTPSVQTMGSTWVSNDLTISTESVPITTIRGEKQ